MTEAASTAERPIAPLAFVDTETDGVHPNRRPWEIAIIRREPDSREAEWTAFVEIDLSTADPFGLQVGRFYDRHPLGKDLARRREYQSQMTESTPTTSARDFVSVGDAALATARLTHGAHIVGATPSFDAEVLDRLLRAHGLVPAWNYHLIDIGALMLGALAAKGQRFRPPYKSDELTTALGVELATDEERHTAMGDTRWVQRVYDAVMGAAQ